MKHLLWQPTVHQNDTQVPPFMGLPVSTEQHQTLTRCASPPQVPCRREWREQAQVPEGAAHQSWPACLTPDPCRTCPWARENAPLQAVCSTPRHCLHCSIILSPEHNLQPKEQHGVAAPFPDGRKV